MVNVLAEQCLNCLWLFHNISASLVVIDWCFFAENRNHAMAHTNATHIVGTRTSGWENNEERIISNFYSSPAGVGAFKFSLSANGFSEIIAFITGRRLLLLLIATHSGSMSIRTFTVS